MVFPSPKRKITKITLNIIDLNNTTENTFIISKFNINLTNKNNKANQIQIETLNSSCLF